MHCKALEVGSDQKNHKNQDQKKFQEPRAKSGTKIKLQMRFNFSFEI
jgi:hypothetical protein